MSRKVNIQMKSKALTLKRFHQLIWKIYIKDILPIPISLCPSHYGDLRDWCVPKSNKLYVFGAQIKSSLESCVFCAGVKK